LKNITLDIIIFYQQACLTNFVLSIERLEQMSFENSENQLNVGKRVIVSGDNL